MDEALWPEHDGLGVTGFSLLLSIILVFPLKYPQVLTHGRGSIGSSGNVRKGRLAIGLS